MNLREVLESLYALLEQTWARNSATIAAELLLVGVIGWLLNFLLGRIFKAIASSQRFARFQEASAILRDNLRVVLLLVNALAITFIVVMNAWWWLRGVDVYSATRASLATIPAHFWGMLALGCAKVLALAIAAKLALRLLDWLMPVLCKHAKNIDRIRYNDDAVQSFFDSLHLILKRATWLGVLVFSSVWLGLPSKIRSVFETALSVYLIIGFGLLLWRALDTLIASLDGLSKMYADRRNLLRYYERLANVMPLFRRSVEYVLYIGVATLVVRQIGGLTDLADWGPRLIRIVGIVFLARVANELVRLLLDELVLEGKDVYELQNRRRATLVPLMRSSAEYVIYFWSAILILYQLSIDPAPILAGAGILALAVGLGAQNLVNDMVSGFFYLFENHYSVGDTVEINGVEGTVEAIELRVTNLRDDGGRLHVIRNGQIQTLVNCSRDYVTAVVDVVVSYDSNVKKVFAVLESVSERARDQVADILAATEIEGLVKFGESGMTVRTLTRARPGCHDSVACELRVLIKEAFEQEGIEMPYARPLMIIQNPSSIAKLASASL